MYDRNVADEPTPAERAYRAHYAQIYRFLLRKTGDADKAEELAQQVFTDAAAALSHSETSPTSLVAWLYTVAERRFVDEIRRRTRSRRAEEMSAKQEAQYPGDGYGAPIASGVRAAIELLPADQREIVILKVLEGRSFAEIAARHGITEGACKMRFSRAIRRVQQSLESAGIEP